MDYSVKDTILKNLVEVLKPAKKFEKIDECKYPQYIFIF